MKTTITINTTKEHFEKYAQIIEKKSQINLETVILARIPKAMIIDSLESGDYSLNNIALNIWDGLAHHVGATAWRDDKAFKSLAEQVCTLKHVAIYCIAAANPEFKE